MDAEIKKMGESLSDLKNQNLSDEKLQNVVNLDVLMGVLKLVVLCEK